MDLNLLLHASRLSRLKQYQDHLGHFIQFFVVFFYWLIRNSENMVNRQRQYMEVCWDQSKHSQHGPLCCSTSSGGLAELHRATGVPESKAACKGLRGTRCRRVPGWAKDVGKVLQRPHTEWKVRKPEVVLFWYMHCTKMISTFNYLQSH